MSLKKVLVKVHPEGKYVVDVEHPAFGKVRFGDRESETT